MNSFFCYNLKIAQSWIVFQYFLDDLLVTFVTRFEERRGPVLSGEVDTRPVLQQQPDTRVVAHL